MADTPVQAITFDVGNTLIEAWPSVGHVYAAVAREMGCGDLDPEALTRRFLAAWNRRGNFTYREEEWFDLVRQSFEGLVSGIKLRLIFPRIYDRFTGAEAWRVFDDVVPALATLTRQGVRLGIISNWDLRLRALLDNLRLSPFFEVIIVSAEQGWHKPDRRIFAQAARQFHLKPRQILHVGDSLEEDAGGASDAGYQARWLRRSGVFEGRISGIKTLFELTAAPRTGISAA